jgi:hypothetical protein
MTERPHECAGVRALRVLKEVLLGGRVFTKRY